MRLSASIFLIGIFMFVCTHGVAQEYIFSTPERLDDGINTDTEETFPLLSGDGRTLYFARAFHPLNVGGELTGTDIWEARRLPAAWEPAINAGTVWNNKATNAVVGTRSKNSIIYLQNSYKNKSGIAFSKQINGSWTEPEIIHIPGITNGNYVGYFVSSDFTAVFLSMEGKDSYGEEDLYVCLKDSSDNWSRPVNLGPTINTTGFEISPFLSADGKRLFFSSNGHGGMGDADIFYTDRLYDSWQTWTAPRNLGETVNSASFDGFFSIYGDSTAFFASNRDKELADIFQCKVSLGDNVFDKEKKYLTEDETKALIGGVSSDIRFESNSVMLTAAQNELLFYVTNKILTKPDIKLQLIIRQGDAQDKTDERLRAVSDKLKSLGITGSRIDLSIGKPLKSRSGDENVVKIIFFR